MAIKRYPQLQSGFLGRADNGLVKLEPMEQTTVGSLLSRPILHSQDDFFYSRSMEVLFNEIIQDPIVTHTLDFQERYLKLLGVLFDKQSFLSFINLQDNNEGLSSQHAKFLTETLRLVNGQIQQRSVSVHTWASLLSKATPQGNFTFRSAKVIDEALGPDTRGYRNLDAFILDWIRRVGWSDLAYSMQVIFGRRTIGATVGYPR